MHFPPITKQTNSNKTPESPETQHPQDFRVSGLGVGDALMIYAHQSRNYGCTPWGDALAYDFRVSGLEVRMALMIYAHQSRS